MNIDRSIIDPILTQALRLPVLAKVRLMERLIVLLEQDLEDTQGKQPLLPWNGLCADLGSAPSAEEIDAMRSEAWADFPSLPLLDSIGLIVHGQSLSSAPNSRYQQAVHNFTG